MNPYWQLKNSLRNKHGRTPEGTFLKTLRTKLWVRTKKIKSFFRTKYTILLFFRFAFNHPLYYLYLNNGHI
jgi:hypothetical protein